MQAVFDDDTSSPVTGASPSGTDDYVTIPEGTQKISVAVSLLLKMNSQ